MSIKRRRLGIVLFSVATLSCLVARMSSSRPLLSKFSWSGDVGGVSIDLGGDMSLLYLIPIILLGVIGLLCFLWPSPRPPKLLKPDK